LQLDQPQQFIASFNRPNLSYAVITKGKDSFETLAQLLLKHKGESAIIYCTSRSDTESIAARLRESGYEAGPYHAGLDGNVRRATQERFIRDELSIVVATIAFGMGIDKPNVRLLVHYDLPKSLEGYYQETGRAGRDGLPSECVLFYTYGDAERQRFFVDRIEDGAERANANKKLAQVVEFCELQACRRKHILGYFGENWEEEDCGGCDFCLTPREEFDATVIAQKILSAVIRTGERFGVNHVCAVLRGGNTKGIRQWRHSELSVYGIVRDLSNAEIKEIFGLLVAEGLLYKNGRELPTFGVTEKGRRFLSDRETLTLARPKREEEKASSASRAALDYDQTLFGALRELRRRLAEERDVPPYVIFGDAALQEMAFYLPQSRESLSRISGVGARKLEQLSDIFLSVIVAHARSHNLQERDIPARQRRTRSRGKEEGKGPAYDLEEIRKSHPKAYEPWTSEEDESLKEMQREGRSVSELASIFGRQPSAIRSRLRKIGFDPRSLQETGVPYGPHEKKPRLVHEKTMPLDGWKQLLQVINESPRFENLPANEATRMLVLRSMIGVLSERDAEIVELRFGLRDGKFHSLEAVGKEFGVSRERIRQIQVRAIRKLRARLTLERRKDSSTDSGNENRAGKLTGSTYDQTRQLLQQGMTIEMVAQQRGLKTSTILNHLERLFRSDEQLDLRPLMPSQERYEKIRAAFEETGGTHLTEVSYSVKEILGDDYSYDEIRLVWMYLTQVSDQTD